MIRSHHRSPGGTRPRASTSTAKADWALVDHPPLGVARLRPRFGIERIEKAQSTVGNALEHLECIAAPQTDVPQHACRGCVASAAADPLRNGSAPMKPWSGEHVGPVGEMLARAEDRSRNEADDSRQTDRRAVIWPPSGTSTSGRSFSTSSCWLLRSLCPLEQPPSRRSSVSGSPDLNAVIVPLRLVP